MSPSELPDLPDLLHQSLVAVAVVDVHGTIEVANDLLWELLGHAPSTDPHPNLADIVHPDDLDDAIVSFQQLMAGEIAMWVGEKRYMRANGEVFWGRLRGTTLRNDAGEITQLLGVFDDVTDRYQALDDLHRNLENQARFVGSVGHELRTPLHAILGFSELLATNTELDDEKQRLVSSVRREAGALRILIDDLLDFTKAGAGGLELHPTQFSPSTMAAGALETQQSTASERNVSLLLEVDPDVPLWVHGDELRVRQVLLNLVTNAVKYTDGGNVRVTISKPAPASEGDAELLQFTVTDTGVGIPQSALATLFDPFAQAHAARSAATGTGLGLAICDRLVALLGGEIHVSSTVGEGSTFSFTANLAEAAAVQIEEQETETATQLTATSVLLVEDSPVNQLLAASQLAKLGCVHALAETGPKGLEMATDGTQYDIILLDWHLPGMDGLEVARGIRQFERANNLVRIPIVSVTARGMAGDREQCLEAGMDDLLRKPVALMDLEQMMAKWVAPSPEAVATTAVLSQAEAPKLVQVTVLDHEVLNALRGDLGEPTVLDAVISAFISELPKRNADLQNGLVASDLELVRRAAHTLKSTAAMLGAISLATLCHEAEVAAKDGSLELPGLVDEIHGASELVAKELQEELTPQSSKGNPS